jgi:hypothetical protein
LREGVRIQNRKLRIMEFPFNCEKLLACDAEGFSILDGRKGLN